MNSNVNHKDEVRNLHLQCVGKIIAGFTHEVKNYLAIINESAGLIGDMIQMGKQSQQDAAEYLQIIRSIEEQIARANQHFRYLNRFAHRMDTELSSFDINESLEELVALVARFANQDNITIEKSFQDEIPLVYSSPSLFQFVVFSILQERFSRLDKNSTITIQTALSDHTVQIEITPEGETLQKKHDDLPNSFEMVDSLIKQLGGNIVQDQKQGIVITLPLKA